LAGSRVVHPELDVEFGVGDDDVEDRSRIGIHRSFSIQRLGFDLVADLKKTSLGSIRSLDEVEMKLFLD
jgi:hypothetical protein